ncbi:nitrogen regulation protein NR(II) [Vitiosangium sp. GDMCC 1.1324]|uniref:two-component system sensor histidine kinase NtrB n=1 Tax=Vitiosangium sp. (strain GDMCC 1.1324) TaxID=2138576 RepID=UPI000D37AF40|nr:ATP-binding protein [Vitiosangium sp. GDMCC 1.1324]PTL85765.1 nitrogen regulation protein NtrB [Vitiosangium sp. GDMCC 1.1324]
MWILERLDVCLSEPLRRAAPEDLGRYRVLVSITLMMLVIDGMTLASTPVSPQPWIHGSVGLFSTLMNTLALVLLRRRASHELSAMLVCTTIAAAFMFTSLTSHRPYTASHAVAMLVPALSVYLVGARQGLLLTVFLSAFVGIVHPLYTAQPGFVFKPLLPGHLWIVDASAAVCILLIWVVSWLHTTSRLQAHSALRDSERKLHSLIENTDDLVCSIDTQGRVIVANSAMRRISRELFGKELMPGEPLLPQELANVQEGMRQRMAQAFNGQRVRVEDVHTRSDGEHVVDISFNPIFGEDGRPLGLTLFGRDVTERKEAEMKLSEMHRTLLDVSRQAGMAEMATGLLHNVGNTLNSVNVSASLVTERLQGLRVGGLARAAELLREHEGDLCAFLSKDPRGRQLPAYLLALSRQLAEEQQALLAEQRTLTEGLEHVKSIVSMQQEHARFSGMAELIPVTRLIDDALRLHATSFERAKIEIRREYADVPPILLDRHKLMQIVLNLLSNARHALADSGRPDKRLTIRVEPAPDDRLRIQVSDNGKGIAPEHLARLFTQGFTTKKDGHGFGLHISALAAIEMAGSLTCDSEGPGHGATFTIELPMQSEEPQA